MEIIFENEDKNLIGSTKLLGIGKRHPKLIYGEQAKKLREEAGFTTKELADKFKENERLITDIENQKKSLNDKLFKKYKEEIRIEKDYFFDLDLETLIITAEGHIIRSFDTSEECKKTFDSIMEQYIKAINEGKTYIIVDFSI